MHKPLVAASLLGALSVAFAAGPFDGTWNVSLSDGAKKQVEVSLSDGKGTWTHFGGGAASKNNPCVNKKLPAVVKSATDSEVAIDIDGNSVVKGCLTETVVLHPGAGGTWTGTLASGVTMTWTRE